MQVAVVTSGVNALSEGVRLKNPLALQDLGPQVPSAEKIILPRHCREELGIAFKSLAAVRDFFGELKTAQQDVEQFCADQTSSEPKRRLSWTCPPSPTDGGA